MPGQIGFGIPRAGGGGGGGGGVWIVFALVSCKEMSQNSCSWQKELEDKKSFDISLTYIGIEFARKLRIEAWKEGSLAYVAIP